MNLQVDEYAGAVAKGISEFAPTVGGALGVAGLVATVVYSKKEEKEKKKEEEVEDQRQDGGEGKAEEEGTYDQR